MQIREDLDVAVDPGIPVISRLAPPTREVQFYLYKDWFTGDWAAVQKEGGLESCARKILGPEAIARTQRLRQEKAAKTSQHCGGDKTALRGWCSVDTNCVEAILAKRGQNGLFCSVNDTDLVKVNATSSMGYEDAMRICGAMDEYALGLHTTPRGFAVWCHSKHENEVKTQSCSGK